MALIIGGGALLGEGALKPETRGIQVGTTAPSWTLTDQSGSKNSLKSLLLEGPVALVFYRSADW